MRIERLADGVTLHLGDCREILPTLGKVDAVVTDPPYGLNIAKRGTVGTSKAAQVKDYGASDWDKAPPPPWLIALMRDISQHQIIFGGNFFDLPPTPCWLVWDKKNTGDFADCELAWTNLPGAVRRIEWLWNGMIRKGSDVREHPTQKPLKVMEWCLDHLPAEVRTICDPFCGSGTTGVAAVNRGLSFIGIEQSPEYFEIALARISEALRAPAMFIEKPKPAKQEAML